MTGPPVPQNGGQELAANVRGRLSDAIRLRDFAVSRNLDVHDDIIRKLSEAEIASAAGTPNLSSFAAELELAIRDLTRLTYPTTAETLHASAYRPSARTNAGFVVSALLVLAIAILGLTMKDNGEPWPSILAAALGLLGALLYLIFSIIGAISEKTLSLDDRYSLIARVALGPVVGWLFYFAYPESIQRAGASPLVLLPFLAGFSTKLVVGIFEQAIRAVELTMGMEEKTKQVLERRRKAARASQEVERPGSS